MRVESLASRTACLTAVWIVLLLAGGGALWAEDQAPNQDQAQKRPDAQVTAEEIKSRLKQLDEVKDLDDAVKGKIRELYHEAVQQLELARTRTGQAKEFETQTAGASDELKATRAELDRRVADPLAIDSWLSLAELERQLSAKEAKLADHRTQLAGHEAETKRRAPRRLEIPKLTAEARARLTEVEKQSQSPPSSEPPQLLLARRTLAAAHRAAIQAELDLYEKEVKAYEATSELLTLNRDLAVRTVGALERELTAWRETVARRRKAETKAQADRARAAELAACPALAPLAKRNAELSDRRKKLNELMESVRQECDQVDATRAEQEEKFSAVKEKVDPVDMIGLTDTMGWLLRSLREDLPDLATHRQRRGDCAIAIRDGQVGPLGLLNLQDRRSDLADLDAQVRATLAQLEPTEIGPDRENLEATVRETLDTEKNYLDKLISDTQKHLVKLCDLEIAETLLIRQTEEYADYIDERVLWIRSAPAFGTADLGRLRRDAGWLCNPTSWSELLRRFAVDCREHPYLLALALSIFGPLVYVRRRLKSKISDVGKVAGRANCCRFFPTIEAVCLTAVLAIIWPGMLAYVAWRLRAGGAAAPFAAAVATGLMHTAGALLGVELLRATFREQGLADAHFGWSDAARRILRSYATWATVLVLPLVFVATAMTSQDNENSARALGRLSFAAALACSAFLVWRILHSGGVYQARLAARQKDWFDRLRPVWYPMAWMVPLALAVLTMAGYYYTAQQLAGRTVDTIWMLFGLLMVRSLLLRWVLVKRRTLAIEQARQRRAAMQSESEPAGEASAASGNPAASEPNLDLATINTQTRRLIEYALAVAGLCGIWLIWVSALPALGILDQYEVPGLFGITWADLGLAAIIISTTMIAARNIPGLLEMTVLQRLPLDAGFRYSIGTVSRYLIIVVGVVAASHRLGLAWPKVQWLVAAISVGLGFGLQEIFANFVSGLIILFERPIRVGDVVTVDEVSGVVSRIRMRATTITNWDRKEFIVPNKEFITGRLMNWTLSDQVNRVVVNIGIAYGSDTRLATELLLEAANEHPLVLKDPAPRVTFENFGDNSLDFVLRCYLPDLDNRLDVIHDLHMTIDASFRVAGIEIAFPQRDIHVRSVDAGLALLGAAAAKKGKKDSSATDDSRQVA